MERAEVTSSVASYREEAGAITTSFSAAGPSSLTTSSEHSFALGLWEERLFRVFASAWQRMLREDTAATIGAAEILPSRWMRADADDRRTAFHRALERAREDAENIAPEEGERPAQKAFAEAAAFVELLSSDVPFGSVWASGDGEVGFTWSRRHGAKGFLEIAFAGRGEIEWAAEFDDESDGGRIAFDAARATRLPEAIEQWVERLRAPMR